MASNSLLCLCMIVKDEAHTIERTLESCLGAIDRYSILDTGSTDGTVGVIRGRMAEWKIPGTVHEGPFTDFATTRNNALDLCGLDSTFILNTDADDVLVGGSRLREFLQSVRTQRDPAYYLEIASGNQSWSTCRLLRSVSGWRYKGVVHELLLPRGSDSYPGGMRHISGVKIEHLRSDEGAKKSSARYERDLKLLQAELSKNPGDTRSAFYIAETYRSMGKNIEAAAAYQRRIDMGGGYHGELYVSALMAARCSRAAGLPWASCVALWHRAIGLNPERSEALADLVVEHSKRDEHALVVLYARRGFEIGKAPEGSLFAEDYAYLFAHHLGWHAWYTGPHDRDLGIAACRRALELQPGSEVDRKNLQNFLSLKR